MQRWQMRVIVPIRRPVAGTEEILCACHILARKVQSPLAIPHTRATHTRARTHASSASSTGVPSSIVNPTPAAGGTSTGSHVRTTSMGAKPPGPHTRAHQPIHTPNPISHRTASQPTPGTGRPAGDTHPTASLALAARLCPLASRVRSRVLLMGLGLACCTSSPSRSRSTACLFWGVA